MAFYEIMTVTFLSLLPIVNPVGMATFFISMTENLPPEERHITAYRVAIYSAILLTCVLLFGRTVLELFGLTLPFIKIAGGLLVSFTAWQMLNAKPKLSKKENKENKLRGESSKQLAFFPLTLPITAGSGAIAIMVAIALSIPRGFSAHSIIMYCGSITGIILMCLVVAVCYRFSDNIMMKLGTTGANVVTRLSAFVLLAIGLQVIWGGLMPLLQSVKS